ncbi:hypothetical protein LZ31DRAFT_86886 [Colletotrichum somersetense]|nr:hypothetical protein LZ31DRAFT_86886 [Colletotrichum somersetense]
MSPSHELAVRHISLHLSLFIFFSTSHSTPRIPDRPINPPLIVPSAESLSVSVASPSSPIFRCTVLISMRRVPKIGMKHDVDMFETPGRRRHRRHHHHHHHQQITHPE